MYFTLSKLDVSHPAIPNYHGQRIKGSDIGFYSMLCMHLLCTALLDATEVYAEQTLHAPV